MRYLISELKQPSGTLLSGLLADPMWKLLPQNGQRKETVLIYPYVVTGNDLVFWEKCFIVD